MSPNTTRPPLKTREYLNILPCKISKFFGNLFIVISKPLELVTQHAIFKWHLIQKQVLTTYLWNIIVIF